MPNPRPRACPNCDHEHPQAITYGLDFVGAGNDDEINRGCLRPDDAPDWHCPTCGHEWANPPIPPCPNCGTTLHRAGPTSVECRNCGYTHSGGVYLLWTPDADPETLARKILEVRDDLPHQRPALLDVYQEPADGVWRNPDGQTAEEELDMFEDILERRLVNIPGWGWMSEDEAIEEIGAAAVKAGLEHLRVDVERMRSGLSDT